MDDDGLRRSRLIDRKDVLLSVKAAMDLRRSRIISVCIISVEGIIEWRWCAGNMGLVVGELDADEDGDDDRDAEAEEVQLLLLKRRIKEKRLVFLLDDEEVVDAMVDKLNECVLKVRMDEQEEE